MALFTAVRLTLSRARVPYRTGCLPGRSAALSSSSLAGPTAGKSLVTAHQGDTAVEHVAAAHEFDGVGDHLAADERGFHALRPHGHPVADGDGIELHGRPAGLPHPLFYPRCQLAQVEVAGHG